MNQFDAHFEINMLVIQAFAYQAILYLRDIYKSTILFKWK